MKEQGSSPEPERYLTELEARKQAETLVQIAAHLNAQIDLDASLSAVCRLTARTLQVPIVTISLYDPLREELYLAYDVGLPDDLRKRIERVPRTVYEKFAQVDGNVVIALDVQSIPNLPNAELYRELNLRTTAGLSMMRGEELIGRLNVGTVGEVRKFTEGELFILRGIADQAAIATHRARLYERVQQYATELEQRVEERTADLATANAEKERALKALHEYTLQLQSRNEELDAFMHTVAHDLQNPLSAIVTYAHVLLNMEVERQPERSKEYVEAILHGAHKTMDIVEALLLLARVRREDVDIEPITNMARIVDEAVGRLTPMIEEHQAQIHYPESWPMALGYGPWIEEIWENYLSNAIKYGGRPPRIVLTAEELETNYVRFCVRDNGLGLEEVEQAHLFTPFTQLPHVTARGHGLGLSIVRRIIGKLNGHVGVESRKGQGSTFYFELPVA